jgi:2,4-dienoyl-CoA reductase-like NADH-dependent reductase (Old Yellow Enzyme family)
MNNGMAISDGRRLFFVALNTGYVTAGTPDRRCLDFYTQRASPDLYCAIVGNVVIPGGVGSNSATPTISSNQAWKDLASAIGGQGSMPGIQLATAWEGYAGARSFRSRHPEAVIAAARVLVAQLTVPDIDRLLGALRLATELSVDAGFRHIQLHAAHGYLFSLLVDSAINPRASEVLDKLMTWAHKLREGGAESSLRVSLRTGYAAFDRSGREAFLDAIALLPVDYVDVSSGFYNIDKQLIYPARPEVIAARRHETVALAERHPMRAFIYSGRAFYHDTRTLPSNVHLGLCRDLIANPDFLKQPERGCANLGKCHYFSRGEQHLACGQWPHQTPQ